MSKIWQRFGQKTYFPQNLKVGVAPIQKWAGEDENERKIKIFAEKGKSVFACLPTYL